MNEPIISPWLFYALFVVDNIKCALLMLMIICVVILFLSPMIDDIDVTKCVKTVGTIFIISGALMVFTPDSKTITQMIIAKHITISNIEKAGQLTERAVDKIIEKIIQISDTLERKEKKHE